ncbi:hypothetical protein [Flagellimonas algicola]|uniref:Uncharacterized protein n=1 Tax=Flagellimonas algicola TaxID=2583815 RepID=A0ABY2WKG5_9FLAO|nr:hypothetical protein [Allomuricauda algicola]TMU55317.1 hypothetical protein FGG15_14165 [Allomuricauda algicola]
MRILTYLCGFIVAVLFVACSGGAKKDISQSPFYWKPKEVDKTKLLNQEFFSPVHENNLGKFVFAHETIPREWEDEDGFLAVYDMSQMDKKGLYCRWFGEQNAGSDKVFETFAKNPKNKKRILIKHEYFLDSIPAKIRFNEKPGESVTWESSRYPMLEPDVIPGVAEIEEEMSLTQETIIEMLFKNQKYVESKKDGTLLLGLKVSVVDGTSPGKNVKKPTKELASGQILLTNVFEGMKKWIGKIPKYSVPEPYVRDKALEKEALMLMRKHARSQGWRETFKRVVITSLNVKRSKFSGEIVARNVVISAVAEWPEGRCTAQFFNTRQDLVGDPKKEEYGRLYFYGVGKQRTVLCDFDE